ncbi:hypothetical protein [Oceanithermus sp.]
MPSLKQLQNALEPHLGERTEAVLKEGLARLGLAEGELSDADAANLLKRVVYRELQRQMDAASARKVVKEVLAGLTGGPAATPDDPKARLRSALSRYSLYFEWPEVQRLRSLAALIEASESEGQSAADLLKEAAEQIDLLDEKLQNALLRQARDISDLEEALERVKSIGGPKLRRLQSLLKQIKEAQAADTLATAEVERARKLAADMRKLVESSVVQNPTLVPEAAASEENGVIAVEEEEPEVAAEDDGFELLIDFESLEPEVADRIREIDLAEERRRLELLKEQYAAVWNAESVAPLVAEVEGLLDSGELAGEKLNQLQLALDDATKDALAEARARYEWLSERLRSLDLEGGLATGRARSQLELIKESLDMGVLPGDLEEAERQIRALEEALVKRRAEEARRARVLEEAESLVANARQALSGEELPELAGFRERLAMLEAGLAAGEVDEALLARLKSELPEALNQIARAGEAAKALRARLLAELDSLPPLEKLKPAVETLRLQVEELPPEEFEAAIASLRQQAVELSRKELQELAGQARRFQLETGAIDRALAGLEEGRFPDLNHLRQEIQAAVAGKREAAKQKLEALAASARRLAGMGGEELLPEIEAALGRLDRELPETAPLEEKLQRLVEKREALRAELARRYQEVRQRYEKAQSVGGETAYRTQTLLNFLEKGAGRLARLGTSGLRDFERALGEAEKLVAQLEEEYEAAKQVAEQLQGADLDDLLGVFDSPAQPSAEATTEPGAETGREAAPPQPDDELAPFRIRGVLWAHKLTAGAPPPQDFDAGLVEALAEDLELLREEVGAARTRATVITMPEHVLFISPLSDGLAVILAEKALLSRLVSLADRHFKEAS